MSMKVDFEELLKNLIELYRRRYPHNPIGVLKYHLKRIGLSPTASIIILAVKNGLEVPEIDKLTSKGFTVEQAAEKIAGEVEFGEEQLEKLLRARYVPGAYQRISIAECSEVPVGGHVSLYGRIVAAYVGSLEKDLIGDLSGYESALFTLRDHSGMILVKVAKPIDITIMRGSIVRVWGQVNRLRSGEIYISAENIVRLQPVEDDFKKLSEIDLVGLNMIPSSMDGKLIKPFKGKPADTITVQRERRFELTLCGCFLCFLTLIGIPILSIFTCCAGLILIILGLVVEHPKVKGFELAKTSLRLLLEHHPPWLRHRCIRLRLLKREIYLCARCTGTFLGYLTASIFKIAFQSILYPTMLGIPALIDWSTQKLSLRESCNPIRVLTGFLLGVGFATITNFPMPVRTTIMLCFIILTAIIYSYSTKFYIDTII